MEEKPLSELLKGVEDKLEVRRTWNQDVGSLLRAARSAANVSQSDLAATAGVNQAYVSQIENGSKTPSEEVIEKLTVALRQIGGTHAQVPNAREDARKARKGKGRKRD